MSERQKAPDAFRTIGEVADWLGVNPHVLRFWESKFPQVRPVKRAGGRRYYRPADMALLGGIKELLHEDGLTIKGAQKVLREQGVKAVAARSRPVGTSAKATDGTDQPDLFTEGIAAPPGIAPVDDPPQPATADPPEEMPTDTAETQAGAPPEPMPLRTRAPSANPQQAINPSSAPEIAPLPDVPEPPFAPGTPQDPAPPAPLEEKATSTAPVAGPEIAPLPAIPDVPSAADRTPDPAPPDPSEEAPSAVPPPGPEIAPLPPVDVPLHEALAHLRPGHVPRLKLQTILGAAKRLRDRLAAPPRRRG